MALLLLLLPQSGAVAPPRFRPLVGDAAPAPAVGSWLQEQLLIQADTLGSAMPLFYTPVNESVWVVPARAANVDGTCISSTHGKPKRCQKLHETFVCVAAGAQSGHRNRVDAPRGANSASKLTMMLRTRAKKSGRSARSMAASGAAPFNQ